MELKKFRNKYDLELIPASGAHLIVGTLVWDPLIGKPKFTYPGMSGNIFNAILDAKLINQEEWQELLEKAKNENEYDANLAESIIDVDVELATTIEHPQIGRIGNSFKLENLKKFSFGELKVKCMSDLLRVRIDDYLDILKKDKWKLYDGEIRRAFMIVELYYGSVKLVIESNMKDELDAVINSTDLELKNKVEFGKSVEYTFSHQNVPFAMRLIKVKEFNC